jgi:G3E family GTPase
MAPRASVPILLLTGFLGSGKTSLLKRWLAAPEFSSAMVIVNELGEVGLDDRLIETASEAPLLLDNGCACCAAGEDLAATLERLFLDRLHRVIPPFSWVLIETTGVARPQPILDLLARTDLVAERYHVAGVVTCFDARRGPMLLATQPECREQITAASTVVITKTDLVDAADLAFARDVIARERPDVGVLMSGRDASVPLSRSRERVGPQQQRSNQSPDPHPIPLPRAGEGTHTATEPDPAGLSAAVLLAELERARQGAGARASGERETHDHAHGHLADVSTAFVPLPPLPRSVLASATELVLAEFGADLLRVKGIVEILGEAQPQVVQAEPGLPLELTPLGAGRDEHPPLGLTLIARGQPARDMAAALLACVQSATHAIGEGRCTHV